MSGAANFNLKPEKVVYPVSKTIQPNDAAHKNGFSKDIIRLSIVDLQDPRGMEIL